jgi:hypothetical protein
MTRRAMLVAVALSCLAGEGQAAFLDGNQLFTECRDGDNPQAEARLSQWGICYGYIVGVSDALKDVCLPNAAKAGQVRDVVALWLRDHPEKRHLPAIDLVTSALKEKFPCRQ